MTTYDIAVHGCDDSTYVQVDLSDTEYRPVARIADLITEVGGGCQPTMEIKPLSRGGPAVTNLPSTFTDTDHWVVSAARADTLLAGSAVVPHHSVATGALFTRPPVGHVHSALLRLADGRWVDRWGEQRGNPSRQLPVDVAFLVVWPPRWQLHAGPAGTVGVPV